MLDFFHMPFILVEPAKILCVNDGVFSSCKFYFPECVSTAQPPIQKYRQEQCLIDAAGQGDFECECVNYQNGSLKR